MRSRTSTGSQSTMYTAPPAIDTLPSIPSRSSSFRSSSPTRSSTHLLAGTRASDDTSLLAQDLPGGAASALSRSSSLRRTSSFDDLTRDFTSVVSRARGGSSTGVTSTTGGGHPVTISSGISVGRGQENVIVSPAPRRSRGDRTVSGSESGTSSGSYQSMTSLVTPSFTATGTGTVPRTLPSTFDTLRSPYTATGTFPGTGTETFTGTRALSSVSSSDNGYGDGTYAALRDSYSSGRPLLDPEQLSEGTPSRLSRSTGVRRGPRSRTQSSPSSAEFLTAPDTGAGSRSSGDFFTAEGESATSATTPTGRERSYTFTPSGTADLSLSRPRSTAPGESEAYSRDRSRTPTGRTTTIGSGESGDTFETSYWTGFTPDSAMSPGTRTGTLSTPQIPPRTVMTEVRTTTTRYYTPLAPPSESDAYRTATSGLQSYASASSGTEEYDSASSGSRSTFFSAAGSSQSSDYRSATSGRSFHTAKSDEDSLYFTASRGQSTAYYTPSAGPSTIYYTAEGLPRSPSPSRSLPVPPTPPYPPLPSSPAASSSASIPVPRSPSLPPLPRSPSVSTVPSLPPPPRSPSIPSLHRTPSIPSLPQTPTTPRARSPDLTRVPSIPRVPSPPAPRSPAISVGSIPTIPSESHRSLIGSDEWLSSPYTLSIEEQRSEFSSQRTASSPGYLSSPISLIGSIPDALPLSTPSGSSSSLPMSSSLGHLSTVRRESSPLTPSDLSASTISVRGPRTISVASIPYSSAGESSTPSTPSSVVTLREALSVHGYSSPSTPTSVSAPTLYQDTLEHLRSSVSLSTAIDAPSSPTTRWTLSSIAPSRDLSRASVAVCAVRGFNRFIP